MITPRFTLSQVVEYITITIRAPYCSLRELDVAVDGNTFLFVCKPYYLRLVLPGDIEDDIRSKSSFDTNSGEFTFTYPKKNPGEHFEDLELITKLLVQKVEASYPNGTKAIEVVSSFDLPKNGDSVESSSIQDDITNGFGFAMRGNQGFLLLGGSSEFEDVFEVDPKEVALKERGKLKIQYEQGKFNTDHYIADFIEDEDICALMSVKCPFRENIAILNLNLKDFDFLKDLKNIQYNLSSEQVQYALNGLIDILYAYCFDLRINNFEECESNVESGWNICKLASTMSWLDGFSNPQEAIISAFRRSLIYPLFRHFELSQTVFDDLKAILQAENQHIVKVLINIYNIFDKGGSDRFILNNLFINDYIVYIMNWDRSLWDLTVKKVLEMKIEKKDLGLNLPEIEVGIYKLIDKIDALEIENGNNDSDMNDTDCYSSEDSSEDSSSSDESTESTNSDDSTHMSIRNMST